MKIGSVSDVVRALQLSKGEARLGDDDAPWGGVVFLVGAGCSKSAGIPLAIDIAQEQAVNLARRFSNDVFTSSNP